MLCKCGHNRLEHEDSILYGHGSCMIIGCPCLSFEFHIHKIVEAEKTYSTKLLIEKLSNALDSGYGQLGETDIEDLLLECEENS